MQTEFHALPFIELHILTIQMHSVHFNLFDIVQQDKTCMKLQITQIDLLVYYHG